MITFKFSTPKNLFLLIGLLSISFSGRTQTLEEFMRRVDSTKNAVLEQLDEDLQPEEEKRSDLSFEPEKMLWKTMYLPYVKLKVPHQSVYDIEFMHSATLSFVVGGTGEPINTKVNLGILSKDYFEGDYTRNHLREDCGSCEATDLPPGKYPELESRNGKYIEYEGSSGFIANPRYLSLTAYCEINRDSVFWVSVRSRRSENFRKTTTEILDYVLSNVEFLDEYGPFQKKYNLKTDNISTVVKLKHDLKFSKESETYMARQSDGDVFVATTTDAGDTYVHEFENGELNQPGKSIRLANQQVRDLIPTDEGFAGLFTEKVPEGKLMFLTHYDESGQQLFKTRLIQQAKIEKTGDIVFWDGYDCHKLDRVGEGYVAYISILKRWAAGENIRSSDPQSACSGNGVHQSEALLTIDADGNVEYKSQPDQSTGNSANGYSMGVGNGYSAQNKDSEPPLENGYWWGASHSFTKDMMVVNDHVLKITVNDAFPSIGLHKSLTDINADRKFESRYYESYYKNAHGKLENSTSQSGHNYVDGLMAGNIHADAENVYASYSKAEDPNGETIFDKQSSNVYDANYHTKDVYFTGVNLTNTPELLETNVKSIQLGEYYLVTWNVFPENAQAGQPQDQMVVVDHKGKALTEIADISTRFFTDAAAGRNSGYFRLHRHNPVYHGSDLVKLDDHTAIWSRVLPETGKVEFITIKLPKQLM